MAKSKFTEAFDSLTANDELKSERVQRILSSQQADKTQKPTIKIGGFTMAKKCASIFKSKRGVALLTAAVIVASTAIVSVAAALNLFGGGLRNIASIIKNTYINMDGITAFAIWNAPETESESGSISAVSYVQPRFNAPLSTEEQTENSTVNESESSLPESWDEDLYDWESDYDWDPTKANVLISIDENGKVSEVIYERTNGRGEVRQDVLGNAAAMYVSNSFTYVMYVSDEEWEWWKTLDYAQRINQPAYLWSDKADAQTVVIHNKTGKVFLLSDLSKEVDKRYNQSPDPNIGVQLFKEDFLSVSRWDSDYPQWYSVVYDETTETIRYEYMIPEDEELIKQFKFTYNIRSARRDIYGQNYLLLTSTALVETTLGIADLSDFTLYDNALIFSTRNSVLYGSDGKMYAFHENKIKVFGENFTLSPVPPGTKVGLNGISSQYPTLGYRNQTAYKLQDGYLYSMFGEVWKVDDDGTLHKWGQLEGSFPRVADDGYLINGEIIAIIDTVPSDIPYSYMNGTLVRIRFDSKNGQPRAIFTPIMKANQILVRISNRMIVEQNERPHSNKRGNTKYFLLTVKNGIPIIEYVAYGYEGGVQGLAKPITEPLILS